jgi:membrane-associated HD superfamily phosphohydrolase
MANFFQKVRIFFNQILTALLFLLAITLVVFMLPRERKFAYEYSKGSPWAYDELTARFGFSIQKTPAELQQERDSVLRKITPYFTYDAFIYADRLNAFKTNFDKKWIAYAMDEYRIDNEQKYLESSRYNSLRMLQDYYHSFIYSNLEQTYLKGIIRIPDTDEFTLTDDSFISVVKGQISEKVLLEQLYTEREAYQLLSDVLNEEAENDMRKQIARFKPFLETFDLSDYLQANVLYDQNKSNLERTAQLKTISETKGYIQEGELLISRGIIVTSETFQILESYKYEFEKQRGNVSDILAWSGRFLLAFISFMVVYLFLYNFRHEVLESLVKTSFILFMMVLMIFIASMVSSYEKKFYYVVPFTILPIIIRTFYDERVGLFIHIITVLLAGFMALNSFDFIFLNIIAGMVALFTLTNLYHRSRFFVSALLVVLSYSITYFGISVVKEGSFSQLDWSNFGYFGLNGVFTLLSFLLIYFFRKNVWFSFRHNPYGTVRYQPAFAQEIS